MNRADRRALERAMRIRPAGSPRAQSGVRLVGGPMDGWYVKPDAPALKPDWHTTWPLSIRLKHRPGRYVFGAKVGFEQTARWEVSE